MGASVVDNNGEPGLSMGLLQEECGAGIALAILQLFLA
jgi:hypothetical protein